MVHAAAQGIAHLMGAHWQDHHTEHKSVDTGALNRGSASVSDCSEALVRGEAYFVESPAEHVSPGSRHTGTAAAPGAAPLTVRLCA